MSGIFSNPDSQLWSTLISFIALILSLRPLVNEKIKGVKIRINSADTIIISHYLGSVALTFFLNIVNIGGRSVSISGIDCIILGKNGFYLNLPVKRYYSRQPSSHPSFHYPKHYLGNISLKPEEHWSEIVHCFKTLNEDEEKEVDRIMEMEGDNFKFKVNKFFNNEFNLTEGDYHLLIAVISESKEILAACGYKFTLYNHHINKLISVKDSYENGNDFYYDSFDYNKTISPRLISLPDKDTMEKIQKVHNEEKTLKYKIKKKRFI